MTPKRSNPEEILVMCEKIIYKLVRKIALDFEESERIENIIDKQLYGDIPMYHKQSNPKHLK